MDGINEIISLLNDKYLEYSMGIGIKSVLSLAGGLLFLISSAIMYKNYMDKNKSKYGKNKSIYKNKKNIISLSNNSFDYGSIKNFLVSYIFIRILTVAVWILSAYLFINGTSGFINALSYKSEVNDLRELISENVLKEDKLNDYKDLNIKYIDNKSNKKEGLKVELQYIDEGKFKKKSVELSAIEFKDFKDKNSYQFTKYNLDKDKLNSLVKDIKNERTKKSVIEYDFEIPKKTKLYIDSSLKENWEKEGKVKIN